MSDSEYTESLDAGQEESEENERRAEPTTQQQQQQQLLYQQQPQTSFMQYAGSSSSSGCDSSVSSTSSDESDREQDSEDSWELTKITEEVLSLPRGLCENPSIFHEFFSLATWQELPVPIQNHLQQFLPDFGQAKLPPQLAAVEKARTLSMLFSGSLHRFQQSPMVQLQRQLEAGNYRPDIRKLKENILKSQQRERKFQHCERLSQMAKQLFLSRQRLLDHAYKSLPEVTTNASQPATTTVVTNSSKRQCKPLSLYRDNKLSAIRARKRFFCEISQLSQKLGIPDNLVLSADDDDDADRLLNEDMKRDLLEQKRSVEQENEAAAAKANIPMAERCVYSTLFRKRSDCEDEAAFRLQQKNHQTRLTNSNFREYLREHKRRKLTEPTLPEFETSDIRLRDVCGRAQMGGNFKRMFGTGKTPGRKPKGGAAAAAVNAPVADVSEINSNSIATAATIQPLQQQLQPLSSIPMGGAVPQHLQQHHQYQTLPPPPPPNLSEPPALVPIQATTIKKPDSYHQQILTANIQNAPPPRTPQSEQQLQQTSLDLNAFHKIKNNNHHNNNSSDTLNIASFMSSHADNLNLCIDETSLLAGDHDAFNMLDSEVELQQEEVETFAGPNDDNNLTSFVIGDDIVLGSRNDSSSHKNDLIKHITNTPPAPPPPHHPMPKLEPINRNSDLTTKHQNNKLNLNQKTAPSTLGIMGVNCTSELIQETHACYFSLIRDFFCSTPNHRIRYDDLKSKIDTWLRNPITALNEWYSLADNWSNLLRSAINFLLGDFPGLNEDYVPYIEHKVQLNIYQWIGAGRDSDTRLVDLCSLWMERRKLPSDQQQQQQQSQHYEHHQFALETKLEVLPKSVVENDETSAENGNILTPPPPPPRCPTNWTVRAASMEEMEDFQRQERERFEQPHRAFTYRMYGYESVVAPVKGIYTPMLALSKPRGHSMMVENRPNFVTILTLVRDATARLPNGEGSRADISELLKCSQYINLDAAENVLQTIVSGALDRMHTEHDACVRYDPKRKMWIYLHRDRSEDDFERIHQQNHNMGKTKKVTQQRKSKSVMAGVNSPEKETIASSFEHIMEATNGSLLTLPALVPANPIVVSSSTSVSRTQPPQHHQIHLTKCPPVPPLKYNIPPNTQQQHQQQKSLLKSAVRHEGKSTTPQTNKQHHFQMPANKSNLTSNTTPIIVATPQGLQTVHVSNATSVVGSSNINISTQQLQQQQQQQQYQSSTTLTPAQQHTNLTANLAGKRVMLNKPIIINQVTNQQSKNSHSTVVASSAAVSKLKSTQQLIKQQHQQGRVHTLSPQQQQQLQQQVQSNVITLPISMANNLNMNTTSDHHQPTDVLNTTQKQQQQQQQQSSAAQGPLMSSNTLTNKQNIIRIMPTSNVKTIHSSTGAHQQHIVNRQRIMTSTNLSNAERPTTPQQQQHQQLKTSSNNNINTNSLHQQLLSNNGNVVTVNSGSSTALNTATGSIVKMSPQAFSALQQKQAAAAVAGVQLQQQQQHIMVKQGTTTVAKNQQAQSTTSMKPQRIILGNTAVMAQSVVQGKNIIFQQIPMPSTSIVTTTPTNTTSVNSSTTTTTTSGNKIQAINTTNLTPQQQRILIQNLKQQQQQTQTINQNQIQFKTVQVVGNNATQYNVMQRSQAITIATSSSAAASSPQTTTSKSVISVSPQDNVGAVTQQTNLTRILKTSPQLKSETTTSNVGSNRVITNSSGQIISLDSLIQKQGGALRITGAGSAGIRKTNGNQQMTTTVLQKPQQQQLQQQQQQQLQQQQPKQQHPQQFAIVSMPNSIISLGNSNNFSVGQRIITTQATGAVNTTMVNVDGTKVTPTSISTSQRRIISTATGSKIATKSTVTGSGNSTTGNIRVLNAVNQTSGINLATLQGKQVVLTSGKTMTAINKAQMQNPQQQSNILQTASGSIVIGGQTIKLQQGSQNIQQLLSKSGNIITSQPSTTNLATASGQMQTVIMGNQILRVQQMPQIVTAGGSNRLTTNKAANNSETTGTVVTTNVPKTIFVGASGQTLRLQPSSSIAQATNKNIIVNTNQQNIPTLKTATNSSTSNAAATTPNRVVLAVQGGGQIFLSPNFQSGNINLKSLQGLKMVSLTQTKDRQATASSALTPSASVNILKTSSTSIPSTTASDGNL